MKVKYFAIIILIFAIKPLHAQILKGSVVEKGSNDRMPNVFILDANTKSITLTDKKGNFEIPASVGHTLIFSSPGYISDTLFVADYALKRVEMVTEGVALHEVTITSSRKTFNPQEEYPEVYRNSKVYILSPFSWFSKQGKDARRLKHYFAREVQERHVDSVFNRLYVSSLIPLRGADLDNFMFMFLPSYAYVTNNNGPSLAAYINDSYKKYQARPPGQRKMQSLTATGN